jgi:hypothetical protein
LKQKVFGEPASKMMGIAWDASDDKAREATMAAG